MRFSSLRACLKSLMWNSSSKRTTPLLSSLGGRRLLSNSIGKTTVRKSFCCLCCQTFFASRSTLMDLMMVEQSALAKRNAFWPFLQLDSFFSFSVTEHHHNADNYNGDVFVFLQQLKNDRISKKKGRKVVSWQLVPVSHHGVHIHRSILDAHRGSLTRAKKCLYYYGFLAITLGPHYS